MRKKILAWFVHLFTSTGLLAAFMALLAAVAQDWRNSYLWLLLCLLIDGIDGTFARLARVREVLPQVQGKYIDYVIDFFTYAILPAYIFFETFGLSGWPQYVATFAILLSSALYYGIENMTSADGKHFVGFPVMWNMVVLLLVFIVPDLPPWWVFAVVLCLAVLHFVPIHVAYPSMGGRWWPLTLAASGLFIAAATISILHYPHPQPLWQAIVLLTSLYFVILTVVDTYAAWKQS